MGGKSRKTGAVSRKLIEKIKSRMNNAVPALKPKVEKSEKTTKKAENPFGI